MAVVVSGAENEQLQRQTSVLQNQVRAERDERARVEQASAQLATGVGQLARSSGALTREIRRNQPISANTLYAGYLANQVRTTFTVSRKGLFRTIVRAKSAPTILATDGKRVYALVHVDDTVFSFNGQGEDWATIGVALDRPASGYRGAAGSLEFLAVDPRVVAVPVDSSQVAALGVKVYALAPDPFKFPDAVLINARGKGYGVVSFKLDPDHPGYVRVDNRLLKRIFGDFAPARGDLVLSRQGDLLGLMVNSDYCALVKDFAAVRTLQAGEDTLPEHTGAMLDQFSAGTRALPLDLQ